MKPISTSTYTFSDLVGGGYVYVDKTANIHAIAAQAKGQYFIARPRRFGKSLLISTLQCIFEGRHELFKGLAIPISRWTPARRSCLATRTRRSSRTSRSTSMR